MYLVDTHTLLWASSDPQKLGPQASKILSDNEVGIFVSIATAWEITIKTGLGKLDAPEDYLDRIEPSGYRFLPIRISHLKHYRNLPLLHRDPFDRMLIAQAQAERLALISRDEEIGSYDVRTVW